MKLINDYVIRMLDKKESTKYTDYYAKEFKKNYFKDIDITKNLRALDVGIGNGRGYYALKKLGFDTYGIDVEKHGDWNDERKILADCRKIPFKEGYFDVLLCSMVLDFIEEDELVLEEMHRVLKPDGMLIIRVINKDNLWSLIWHKQWDKNHAREYSIKDLKQLLLKKQFGVSKLMTLGIPHIIFHKKFQLFFECFVPKICIRLIGSLIPFPYRLRICVVANKN